MNKTAIKNFAIWARNKLIADISYKAGLLGITAKDIKSPLPQSTQTVQFFDIGTKEPSSITGKEIEQRKKLVEEIQRKAKQSDYSTAYKNVIEEVAYTWFNRLIAIRFMEVNDYLPTRIRVLSSEGNGKAEPDLVTHAMEASLDYSAYEKDRIMQLKHENKLDELFRMLFIKQCNALNANLPELFEKTSDYTELLLNVSFTDKDGVVYHLANEISEDDFNVSKEGQVEIIGWLYQYYNTEPKDETFALLKKNIKITKEHIPAATQLFTPDWIVRYMVENSLGRLWIEGHPNEELKSNWKYYLDEPEQEEEVQKQLEKIREEYKTIKPEDIKVIDPAMGSGHILVYAFDVLMQIYESQGYSKRDAAKSIVENNLYGLDIDNRAYQLAYFAVKMKARQYNRRILNDETKCNVYAIQESNDINRNQLKYFGAGLSEMEKNTARLQIQGLLDTFSDAKEYGSILNVENYNWQLLRNFINVNDADGQMSLDTIGIEYTRIQINRLVEIAEIIANKYDVVVTNPPYMSNKSMRSKLAGYIQIYYPLSKYDLFAVFIQKCNALTKNYGLQAMITQHSWMFLSSYENLRINILEKDIINMVHLGARAFEEIAGEVVQTTSFVQRISNIPNYIASYKRLVNFGSQKEKEIAFLKDDHLYRSRRERYSDVPGSPIAYWMGENFFHSFSENLLENLYPTKKGMFTGDNEYFLRFWHEVNVEDIGKNFLFYNKGGGFKRWFGFKDTIVKWHNNGAEIKNFKGSGNINEKYFYKSCLTWNLVSTAPFCCRIVDDGFVMGDAGPICMVQDNNKKYLLGFMNSGVCNTFMSVLNPTMNYPAGIVGKLPIIFSENKRELIERLVDENIEISRRDWNDSETSIEFEKHPLTRWSNSRLYEVFKKRETNKERDYEKLEKNESELNSIFNSIYQFRDELFDDDNVNNVTISKVELGQDIRSFISYAIGCMFGRYSIDIDGIAYAGGEWNINKYSSYIPDTDNILPITDEEYFKDDIVGLFIAFVKKIYGQETLEENLDFIANALGNKSNSSRETIRAYFIKDFFKDHSKIYQKRPIYWLFDSGKQNGFKALVYMHRYDENTIGNLRIDYLHKMQRIYENEIARMQDTIENSKDSREVTAATKRKEKLIKQLQETKEYDEKIAHLALARISIDLDDGVKVNYEKVQTDTDGKKLDVLAKI